MQHRWLKWWDFDYYHVLFPSTTTTTTTYHPSIHPSHPSTFSTPPTIDAPEVEPSNFVAFTLSDLVCTAAHPDMQSSATQCTCEDEYAIPCRGSDCLKETMGHMWYDIWRMALHYIPVQIWQDRSRRKKMDQWHCACTDWPSYYEMMIVHEDGIMGWWCH